MLFPVTVTSSISTSVPRPYCPPRRPTAHGVITTNLKLSYQVSFAGTNKPASLYTLQGTVGCNAVSNFFDLPNEGGTGTVNSTSNQWVSTSDCATATLSSLKCNTVNIEISGPGISSRVVSYPFTFTPLSVTLLDSGPSPESNGVQLNSTCAAEINNAFFTVREIP